VNERKTPCLVLCGIRCLVLARFGLGSVRFRFGSVEVRVSPGQIMIKALQFNTTQLQNFGNVEGSEQASTDGWVNDSLSASV
jgi:hypothetical protein